MRQRYLVETSKPDKSALTTQLSLADISAINLYDMFSLELEHSLKTAETLYVRYGQGAFSQLPNAPCCSESGKQEGMFKSQQW